MWLTQSYLKDKDFLEEWIVIKINKTHRTNLYLHFLSKRLSSTPYSLYKRSSTLLFDFQHENVLLLPSFRGRDELGQADEVLFWRDQNFGSMVKLAVGEKFSKKFQPRNLYKTKSQLGYRATWCFIWKPIPPTPKNKSRGAELGVLLIGSYPKY